MKSLTLKAYLISLLLIVCHSVIAAESLEFVEPEEVGFDAGQLSKIDTLISNQVENGEIAGAVTLIARHGKIAHMSALGYQDVVQGIPMEEDTIFRLYSMTKPIASTALMMLYQDGLFHLNDPLSKFIPEFANLTVMASDDGSLEDTVPINQEATVQDILRHTAGFSHGIGIHPDDGIFEEKGIFSTETSLTEMMSLIAEIPMPYQPGEQYFYSVGPDIALRLVEIISGMAADEYLEQRIFEPLGMVDTGYVVPAEDLDRFSPVHWMNEGELLTLDEEHGSPAGGVLVEPWSVNSYHFDHEFKGGSFGLVASTEDYFRFAQAMLNRGELDGERIIAPGIVDFMSRNHLTEGQKNNFMFGPGLGFGLGFAVIEDPAQVGYPSTEGTFYWGGAAATTFWIDPVEDIVVVQMTQHMATPATGPMREELSTLVYSSLLE